jgi:hypothetical protein
MGVIAGANINDNGLIFSLDAANFRSYSGSGLTSFGLVGGIGGTLVNGTGFSSANGGSFFFDGTNDYVFVGDNSLLNSFTNMTLEVVTKYTTTNDQIFAQKVNYALNHWFGIEIYSSTIAAACYQGGANYLSVPVSSYPANFIYHFAITLNGTIQTLYVNGVSVASNSSGAIPSLSGNNFVIGARSNISAPYLNGNVYSTKFYNRALTAQEIKQNYNATKRRYSL